MCWIPSLFNCTLFAYLQTAAVGANLPQMHHSQEAVRPASLTSTSAIPLCQFLWLHPIHDLDSCIQNSVLQSYSTECSTSTYHRILLTSQPALLAQVQYLWTCPFTSIHHLDSCAVHCISADTVDFTFSSILVPSMDTAPSVICNLYRNMDTFSKQT